MRMLLTLIGEVVALITRFATFIAIVLIGGIGSAWVMIHSGSPLSTVTEGSWVTWPMAGRTDADPYTRAHGASLGLLALNSSLSTTFHARLDADGERIHSSCEYALDLEAIDAAWWSLVVFDDRGAVIPNPAQRHAFNASTVVRDADGGAMVVLAREARPGNWLPTRGAGYLTLAFTVQDPRWSRQVLDTSQPGVAAGAQTGASGGAKSRALPLVRKVGCS
jgi:hypothetical protein